MNEEDYDSNLDQGVIDSFGHEWSRYSYSDSKSKEALDKQFKAYCLPIDLMLFNENSSIAADFGAGSGRWSSRLLPYVNKLYVLEPSDGAYEVLLQKFSQEEKITILHQTVGANSIPDNSLDLAMSLGVLHHIPDTALAIRDIAQKIKPGHYFLCYLYYKLDNKPIFYRVLLKVIDQFRIRIARLSPKNKRAVTLIIAASIYLPLARLSKLLNYMTLDVSNIPLHHYAQMPFVMLANDALDRFGTSLEQRFSKTEICEMLNAADFDLETLKFSDVEPFWCFAVKKNF